MSDDPRTERLVRDWLDDSPHPRPPDRVIDVVLDSVSTIRQESADPRAVAIRRLGRFAMATAAVLAVGALAVVVLVRPGEQVPGTSPSASPSLLPTSSPTTSAAPSSTRAPGGPSLPPGVTAIDMGIDTWSLTVDDASVWVQVGESGMSRIDRATNAATGPVVPEVPQMQFEDGHLWALDIGTGIVRVNPLTGEILETIPGISGFYIAVDGRTAWVSDVGHTVDRIDLDTGEVVASIDVPAGPKEMVVFDGDLWVTCDQGGVVARIDGETNSVVATIDAGWRPVNLAGGEGAVWVWTHDPHVLRIDPATNTVVATITGVAQTLGIGVAAGGGSVWVVVSNGIGRVDPATNEIVEVIPIGRGGYVDLVWFDDELWASSTDRNTVFRLETTP